MVGPPGSGKTTQADAISKSFGLVHICIRSLILNEVRKNPVAAKPIALCIEEGRIVPDNILLPIVEKRLSQTDCKLNGWILDGFPQNESQINLLNSLKIKPSLVCVFEMTEEQCYGRLSNRKVDSETGDLYDISISPPQYEDVASRLVDSTQDTKEIIKHRWIMFNETYPRVEDAYKKFIITVQPDISISDTTDLLSDAIVNPIC